MNKKLAEERLIDWLLYNIDIIKKLLEEMAYLESTVVYNDYAPGTTATDRMEKIIVFVDESMQIIKVVENAIERLSDDLFDALISIYFDGKTLKESAEVLGNTVQAIQIEKLEERLDQAETRMETVEEVFGQAQIIKQRINRVNSQANAPDIAYMILHLANKYKVDHRQIAAQAEVESAYRINAVGKLGERGLLQVRQSTFREHGHGDIDDWRDTLEAGVRYMAWLNRHYGESILSYNAGPNHPRKHIVSRGYSARVRQRMTRLGMIE